MIDETSIPVGEVARTPETFPLQTEYQRCVGSLNRVGITSLLPHKESLGILGPDGKEYPIPTPREIQGLFDANKALVKEKMNQGFTRLALTPFAMPMQMLSERVKAAIRKHAQEGKIFQAKQTPSDPDTPIAVNLEDPLYMWESILTGEKTGDLVYFPKAYTKSHHGVSKDKVIISPDVCAVPGWSIGLIEDARFLPREGQAKIIGGRRQLDNNHTPNDYLKALQGAQYKGESGWAPEDFLVDFVTRLEETNQVSHDWDDYSALWLTGAFLPKEGFVPFGHWPRGDRALHLYGDDPDYRYGHWGASSTVRLLKP